MKEISLNELDFCQRNDCYLFTKTLLLEIKLILFLSENDVIFYNGKTLILKMEKNLILQ